MMDHFFYSFLSGLCWLLGLETSSIDFYKMITGSESGSFLNVAIYCGLLNTILLILFYTKKELDFKIVGCIGLPPLIFEFFCRTYFLGLFPGLRSAGWIMIFLGGVLYFLSGSGKVRTYFMLCPVAFFIPLPGSLSLLILVAILMKVLDRPQKILTNVIAGLVPLLVVKGGLEVGQLAAELGTYNILDFSLTYICASLGAALALYILRIVIYQQKIKQLTHVAVFTALALLFFTSRYGDDLSGEKIYVHRFSSMGTVCEITLWSKDSSKMEYVFAQAEEIFSAIEDRLTTYRESELTLLNSRADIEPVKCSPMLWTNLMLAKRGWEISDGAFDVTVGPLVKLWAIKQKRSELPTPEEIQANLKLVGFDKLIIDEKLRTVKFPAKGFKIDFGGITKGWAVDQARDYLEGASMTRGIINLGGNIYCFGTPPKDRSFYSVGIKDPRNPERLAAKINLLGQGISTSGNYEQFIMIDGVRYTHLIDPRTGMPINGVDSVSVVCPSAAMSDILSTAIFVGGESVKKKLRKKSQGWNYLWIDIRETGLHVIEKFGTVFEAIDLDL